MKFYLAARYSRREELNQYRKALEEAGHTVQARWLDGEHEITDTVIADDDNMSSYDRDLPAQFAIDDIHDIRECDAIISFTEEKGFGYSRGGRHVEFGLGYEMDKRLFIVGPREHVFHYLPSVVQFDTWEAFWDA